MRQIDDATFRNLLDIADRTRRRIAQDAWQKKNIDHNMANQYAAAVAQMQSILANLPVVKETKSA